MNGAPRSTSIAGHFVDSGSVSIMRQGILILRMFPHKLVATPKASHETAVAANVPKAFVQPSRIISQLPIKEGMRVADFGAGSGVYTLALAEAVGVAGHIFAVDVQQDLLLRIRNTAVRDNRHNIDIVWGNVESKDGSKIAASSLDMVLVSNMLFQAEHRDAVLVEAKRILVPGGLAVIIDWSDSGGSGAIGPHEDHLVTKEAALALVSRNGFALVREFDAGSHHYGLVVKRI